MLLCYDTQAEQPIDQNKAYKQTLNCPSHHIHMGFPEEGGPGVIVYVPLRFDLKLAELTRFSTENGEQNMSLCT